MANVLTYLAIVYQAQARDADAEAVAVRALAIQEAALGMAHPDVATTLDNLALIQSRQGRYAEAESLYKRSLATAGAASGRDHSDLAPALANLGALYYVLRPLRRCRAAYEARPVHLRRRRWVPSIRTSARRSTISLQLYRAQARYTDAEPASQAGNLPFGESIRAAGPSPECGGVARQSQVRLYRTQGRYGDAELLATRALAVSERRCLDRASIRR